MLTTASDVGNATQSSADVPPGKEWDTHFNSASIDNVSQGVSIVASGVPCSTPGVQCHIFCVAWFCGSRFVPERGCQTGEVSVPVGTSGCTHWFGLSGGDYLHFLSQTSGEKCILQGRGGLLSLWEQKLLLPLAFQSVW